VATSRDVIAFRLGYPEFKAMSDADISTCLDDADVWLDSRQWAAADFPTARSLWTAHNLNIWIILQAQQEVMGPKLGFTNQTLATVSFGERRVAFKQLMESKQKGGTPNVGDTLDETWYGQQFKLLRVRNIMPIMTV
jgi:hypothetical protein